MFQRYVNEDVLDRKRSQKDSRTKTKTKHPTEKKVMTVVFDGYVEKVCIGGDIVACIRGNSTCNGETRKVEVGRVG